MNSTLSWLKMQWLLSSSDQLMVVMVVGVTTQKQGVQVRPSLTYMSVSAKLWMRSGKLMRTQHKLSSIQTLLSQNPFGLCRSASFHRVLWCNRFYVPVLIIKRTPHSLSPETVSTDGVSLQRQSATVTLNTSDGFIWRELSLPGASGVCERACRSKEQMDFRVREAYQEATQNCVSGLKSNWTQTLLGVKERMNWPGEVLYVHQHGVLLHMQLISQQQQLHQLLIQTC